MSSAAASVSTPFSGSPDPTAVFLTASIKAVLYKTRYAIEHRQGLAAILGDPGLGKSTLMRYLYAHFASQENFRCAYIPNPHFTSDFAALRRIATELGIDPKKAMSAQQATVQAWLTEQFKNDVNVVVLMDEAQRLDSEQLELCRTLVNFETGKEKLIQVVLAGNLELRDRLKLKKHKPLLSRVFAPSLLSPMTPDEMIGMLQIRCERSNIPFPFDTDAVRALYEYSAGVPRHALMIAEFSHAHMRTLELPHVTREIVESVVAGLKIDDDE